MLRYLQILVSTIVFGISAVCLTACGQQGALYLPTEPAAANRSSLPETLLPLNRSDAKPAASPASTPEPQ